MGRRGRRRAAGGPPAPTAPASDYRDAEGNVLTLRGVLTAATRRAYDDVLSGRAAAPGAAREDAWQRAGELLFERLAVRWTIAGVPTERPAELLARYRAASEPERRWVREVLREHAAEHFPELRAP